MTFAAWLRPLFGSRQKGATLAKEKPTWTPTALTFRAFQLAADGHAECVRKGSSIPYLGHLLGVSSLVIEAGGSEEQAAAALLHDLLEDTPTTRDELAVLIGGDSGASVADMVNGCTDTMFARKQEIKDEQKNWPADKKAASWWNDRKAPYVDKLTHSATTGSPYVLVSLADKTYNAENTVADLRKCSPGEEHTVWAKFNVGYEYQKLWYQGLVAAFETGCPSYTDGERALFGRFVAAVAEMFPPDSP